MMKIVLGLSVILALLAGCGGVTQGPEDKTPKTSFTKDDFPAESATIFGGWERVVGTSGGPLYRLFFNRRGQIGMEMICDDGAGDLRASAMGTVKVEASTFSILQDLSGSSKGEKGQSCSFMWAASQSVYSMSADVLTISAHDGTGAHRFKRMW